MRVNVLPTRVRVSWGSPINKLCKSCNTKTETLYHVIQGCSRTHGMCIKRRVALVRHVAEIDQNRGKNIIIEPRIMTSSGLRKPDLIIIKGTSATVVDMQIIGIEATILNCIIRNKVYYYSENPNRKASILENLNVTEVDFIVLSIHYKGFICKSSYTQLLNNNILISLT